MRVPQTTFTADTTFAHNPQRGQIVKNRFKFCLFLENDPSDDYLTAHTCPARAFGPRHRLFCYNRNPFFRRFPCRVGPNVEVVAVVNGEYDPTFDPEYGDTFNLYDSVCYAVTVNGAAVAQCDDYSEAYATAHAVSEYGRTHPVETSRLS